MRFETYEKLKRYAALYPDRIDTVTQEELDRMSPLRNEVKIHESATNHRLPVKPPVTVHA